MGPDALHCAGLYDLGAHVAIVPGPAVMLAVLGYENQAGARALFEGEGGGEGIG